MSTQAPKILIVGGVAGGASAATRARRMNEHAEIIMFEKDTHISFANCGLPYHIGEEIADREKLLVAKPKLFHDRFNIAVRTRHEVTAINRQAKTITVLNRDTDESYEESYDKLILAPGATPLVPPIPGADAKHVYTLRNVEDTDRVKAHIDQNKPQAAVIIGGGYIGLEVVEQLVHRGVPTALVEREKQILPLMDHEMVQPLEQALRDHGVKMHLADGIKSIKTNADGEAVGVELDSGTVVDADFVLLGIGVRPSTKLAEDAGLSLGETRGVKVNEFGQTSDPDIYCVGDAVEYQYAPAGKWMRVALAGPANRAGRLAGEHAATGASAKMQPVMGTAIVRVFELTAGMTGLSMKAAERFNIDANAVTIIANHHVGYYPDAKPVTLKLVYDPTTGKVLGAQATGEAGIDKRIDVVATAMHFGGDVRQLAGVDLAYAPPFGAAKDPIHMAAFTACNALDGVFDGVLQPDADLSEYQVVDVRTDKEVATKPIPNASHAVHLEIETLRERLQELDPSKPTAVICASGVRSYIGTRILKQHGFDNVFQLSGGQTLRARAFTSE